MTIACGMKFRDGIMLFADTEYSSYDVKTFGTKLFPTECAWGKVIFSFSGAEAVGKSTISKCVRALRKKKVIDNDEAADVVEQVVSKEYTARVLTGQQNQNDFSLLFALFNNTQQSCDLYASYQTSVTRLFTHRCIGIGASLGHYLMDSGYSPDLDLDSATIVAVNALTRIKKYMPGCGGRTEITVLGNDGAIQPIHSVYLASKIEEYVNLFDAYSSILLTATMKIGSDEAFKFLIGLFVEEVTSIRKNIQMQDSLTLSTRRETSVQGPEQAHTINVYTLTEEERLLLGTLAENVRRFKEVRSSLQLTTRDPQSLPASQE
jgi:20S proteasome alpha/beta subunit